MYRSIRIRVKQKLVSWKMLKYNKEGIRQYAWCCLDLYVLQQSSDRWVGWGDKVVQQFYEGIKFFKNCSKIFWKILNFYSCALLQHERNVIRKELHRVFNATFNWLDFDQALRKNKACWTKNQYPDEWSSKTVNQTIEKIIISSKQQL